MEKFGISFGHLPVVNNTKAPVIEHEYQEIGIECEAYFKSKRVWALFSRVGVTNSLMRYALKECKTRNKPYINYFITIINNKISGKKI